MTRDSSPTRRDLAIVACIALASILVAAPGVHVFERWLARTPAVLVSHGLALAGLAVAVLEWRRRRTRRAA